MKRIEFSKEQIEQIKTLYENEGWAMWKIGEQFNVSRSVIARIFKENNIQTNKDNHKYKADYRKFEYIDSEEKAYWLGFIAADGCNYEREQNATIVINLAKKDKEQLEKFKKFMNSDVQVKDFIQNAGFSNNSEMSKIVFNSKEMSHDLTLAGVPPKKSLILKPPIINEKYYFSYILGYFDGDGSIFQNSNGEFGICIVGTKEILEWINSLLNISSHLEKRSQESLSNNYYIRCGGFEKPYQIMKKLYDSCPVHLERKFSIYKNLETVVLSRNTK